MTSSSVEESSVDLTDADIEAAHDRGEKIFEELLELLDDCPEDSGAIIYSLWVSLTHCLAEDGWTAKQLADDAAVHVTLQLAND